ncbi:MAG: AEC family transporter [Anaerolineaceae bacterium]
MILDSTLIVVQQILILFFLIAIGYFCGHFKIISGQTVTQLTDLLLIILTPAVIITAFQVSGSDLKPGNMLIAAGIALLTFVIGALLSWPVFRRETDERKRVLTFSTVFFNAGFFGLPLLRAVLGDLAVVYGSIFVAVFNVVLWTYGVALMDGREKGKSLKNLLNPGVITVVIVLLLYALKITLPEIIQMPISSLSTVQSPLAMIIIGVQFYNYREQFSFKDLAVWKIVMIRNLAVPLLVLPFIYLLTKDPQLFFACAMMAATPTAANSILFATKYERDVNLTIQALMLTTIMAIITIPIVIALSRWVLGAVGNAPGIIP